MFGRTRRSSADAARNVRSAGDASGAAPFAAEICTVLGRLTPDAQRVLRLTYFAGRTVEQIEATIGLPADATRRILAVGLRELGSEIMAVERSEG